jgi:hypothetical protein
MRAAPLAPFQWRTNGASRFAPLLKMRLVKTNGALACAIKFFQQRIIGATSHSWPSQIPSCKEAVAASGWPVSGQHTIHTKPSRDGLPGKNRDAAALSSGDSHTNKERTI